MQATAKMIPLKPRLYIDMVFEGATDGLDSPLLAIAASLAVADSWRQGPLGASCMRIYVCAPLEQAVQVSK